MNNDGFLSNILLAQTLIERIEQLYAECMNSVPAEDAPDETYLITIGNEFCAKPSIDAIKRASSVNAELTQATISSPLAYLCESMRYRNQLPKEPKQIEFTVDKGFIEAMKKKAKTPLMSYLVKMAKIQAEAIGAGEYDGRLRSIAEGEDADNLGCGPAWTMLATTIRTFIALALNKPVNVSDVVVASHRYKDLMNVSAERLTEYAYQAIIMPGINNLNEMEECVSSIREAAINTAGLLAACNALDVGSEKKGISIAYSGDHSDEDDLLLSEIVYLSKEANGMDQPADIVALEKACTNAVEHHIVWREKAKTIAEYFNAIKRSL